MKTTLSVKTKFQFGAACILFLYCVTAAAIAYQFLKGMVSDEIYKETQLLESTADATRTYVKDALQWFSDNPDQSEWQGMINKNGNAYYTRMRAIYAENECLRCHGHPADSPSDMKAIYGIDGGYGYRVGDVVAADTIYIPVGFSFVRI